MEGVTKKYLTTRPLDQNSPQYKKHTIIPRSLHRLRGISLIFLRNHEKKVICCKGMIYFRNRQIFSQKSQ